MRSAAELVREARLVAGLSRASMARLAGVAPSTVGRIESGLLDPSWTALSNLLNAAGFRAGEDLKPLGDTAAIAAARRALGERTGSTRGDEWTARWVREGALDGAGTAKNPVKVGVLAGTASRISARPGRRAAAAYERPWPEVARALAAAGIRYAITGIAATSPTRTTDGNPTPTIYVDDPTSALRAIGREAGPREKRITLLEADDLAFDGTVEEDGITWTSPAQALIDAFAGAGRSPDMAEAVAAGWRIR